MSKRRRDCDIEISSSKLDCVTDFCFVHKKFIERILSGATRARSDVTAKLTNNPAGLVMNYLEWGAAVPDWDTFVDILKDICRRNMAVLSLYQRIPGFQHDPLLKGFRKEIKQVSIRS
jgi:hypothetical protein